MPLDAPLLAGGESCEASVKSSGLRNLPPPIKGLHEILTGTKKHDIFQTYAVRWFILFVICLLAFNHAMFWMTFVGLSNATIEYYRLCDVNMTAEALHGCEDSENRSNVALLQLWAPMVAVLSLPLAMFVARASGSTRRLLLFASSVSLASAVLRVLPGTPFVSHSTPGTVYFAHASQAVNGIVGAWNCGTSFRCATTCTDGGATCCARAWVYFLLFDCPPAATLASPG